MARKEASSDKRFKFTEARIRDLDLPPQGKRYTFYDTITPPLECRITALGSKTFNVFHWSKTLAQPIRVSLGKWPTLTVEEARVRASAEISEIEKGKHPVRARRSAADPLSIGAAIKTYIDGLVEDNKKPTTIATYRYFSSTYLAHWHRKKLAGIDSAQVKSLRSEIRDKDNKLTRRKPNAAVQGRKKTRPKKIDRKVTANRVIRFLSQVYNHAIKSGWKGINPCNALTPLPETPRTRRLEENEIGPFLRACEEIRAEGDPSVDYLLMCLYTGARRSNVSAAKWEEINLKFKIWNIPDTKNNAPHTVYLSSAMIDLLERRKKLTEESPYVFPAASASGHLEEPRKLLWRVLKRADINPNQFSIHTLKHSFISIAYEVGINPTAVSRMGGHRIKGITARYGHASESKVREGYERVAEYVRTIAGPTATLLGLSHGKQ